MRERDVAAFERRARSYEDGRIGQLHQRIVERVAGIARPVAGEPDRILDVGCGTGAMLRLLADRLPRTRSLAGIDAAPEMIRVAAAKRTDARIEFGVGVAEQLPYGTGVFDFVVSTTSFDHWSDQGRGLRECARVLRPGGVFVLCDLFSPLLLPTVWFGSRRHKARTVRRAEKALHAAGFRSLQWHRDVLITTVVAR